MTDVAEKPLVTFALFAYNQERYIREAVEAALAQDYPNLEIIISDDCSNDGTFDVIDSVVSKYACNHRVSYFRNSENLGIVGSVNKVFSCAVGELVVMAAGDDLSLPSRVSDLVDAWLASGKTADCVYSNCTVIDACGRIIGTRELSREAGKSLRDAASEGVLVLGAVAAWTRRLWLAWGGIDEYGISEDSFLSIRAKIDGGLICVHKNLVNYRKGTSSWVVNVKNRSDVVRKGRVLSRLIYRNAKSNYRAFLLRGDHQLIDLARANVSRSRFYLLIHSARSRQFCFLILSLFRKEINLKLALTHFAYRFFPGLFMIRKIFP